MTFTVGLETSLNEVYIPWRCISYTRCFSLKKFNIDVI